MKRILVLVWVCASWLNGYAQEPCQTVQSPVMLDQLRDFVQHYYHEGHQHTESSPTQKYVRITMHLVGDSDGSNRYAEEKVLPLMCGLNELYEQTDAKIHFYLNDIKFINNTAWNANTGGVRTIMPSVTKVANSINVYILNNTPTSDICGVYYGAAVASGGAPGTPDIIVMTSGCASPATFAHEVGHYLSLPHTFYGWEGTGTAGSSGNAPNWAERADGSNCTSSGDFLCDTGPDYLYGRWSTSSCQAQGTVSFGTNGGTASVELTDPVGTAFTVDGRNVMSYTSNGCMSLFTDDQINAMHFNLTTYRTNHIVGNGAITPVDSSLNLLYPIAGDIAPYGEVTLEWNADPAATQYIVEMSYVPTFSAAFNVGKLRTSDTTATFTGVQPNRNVFWRVTPYNASFTCSVSTMGQFQTGDIASSTISITAPALDWRILPNPVQAGENFEISLSANATSDASLTLYSLSGQVLHQQPVQAFAGTQYLRIAAPTTPGVYLVKLRDAQHQTTQKLVVLE